MSVRMHPSFKLNSVRFERQQTTWRGLACPIHLPSLPRIVHMGERPCALVVSPHAAGLPTAKCQPLLPSSWLDHAMDLTSVTVLRDLREVLLCLPGWSRVSTTPSGLPVATERRAAGG